MTNFREVSESRVELTAHCAVDGSGVSGGGCGRGAGLRIWMDAKDVQQTIQTIKGLDFAENRELTKRDPLLPL